LCFGISILSNTIGAGALHPDGYIYIYGIRGINKELLVARVKDYQFENLMNGNSGMAPHGMKI
jgi:hypothetical protein